MRITNQFFVLASVCWGDEPQQVPPRLQDHPSFAIVSAAQKQQIYAPVRLRVDTQKGLHLLNDDYRDIDIQAEVPVCVTHLTPAGEWSGRTPIPPHPARAHGRRIEDFAVDLETNVYFLESFTVNQSRYFRLVKLSKKGEVIWETKKRCGQHTGMDRLFIDNQMRLYMANRAHQIVQIDPGDGHAVSTTELRPYAEEKLLISPAGDIFRMVFHEEHGRYAITAYDPISREEKIIVDDAILQSALPFCFGIDGAQRFYAYQSPREGRAGALVKIPRGDPRIENHSMGDLVVQTDHQAIFTHRLDGASAVVTGHLPDGARQEWVLGIPEAYEAKAATDCRLIKVDEARRFHLLVGEAPRCAGIVLVFDEQGALLSAMDPAPKLRALMSAVQPFRSWQVDDSGNVYFPVLTPGGVTLVCLAG